MKTVCSVEKLSRFDAIVNILQEASKETLLLIPNVIVIVKLLLVNAATSATPERSFSMARRIKTWLRTRMTQHRFNVLAILNNHKDLTDDMSVIDIGNEFVKSHPKRYETFGLQRIISKKPGAKCQICADTFDRSDVYLCI